MELLDKSLRQSLFSVVNNIVNTVKVINGLYDIIHIDSTIRNTNRIRLKNVSRLIVSQFTALDMVGVIGQIDLSTMIDTAL